MQAINLSSYQAINLSSYQPRSPVTGAFSMEKSKSKRALKSRGWEHSLLCAKALAPPCQSYIFVFILKNERFLPFCTLTAWSRLTDSNGELFFN